MIIAIYIYITFLQKIWIFEINNTFFFYFSKKIVKRSMFRTICREKKRVRFEKNITIIGIFSNIFLSFEVSKSFF